LKRNFSAPKGNILLVEDDKVVAKDLSNVLKKFGYTVPNPVSSAEEAIRKLEESTVDLVLMDIVLKGDMDGVAAAKYIANRFKLPIIHLSAYGDDETLEQVKGSPVYGYILKPLSKERELYVAIEMALHKHRSNQAHEMNLERKIEDLRQKLQRLQQFSEVKDALFKKFLQDLSNPLQNLNVAIHLLKESTTEAKSDYYLRIIEEEFNREVELINQTSSLGDLLNVENVELLNQFSLLRQNPIEKPSPVAVGASPALYGSTPGVSSISSPSVGSERSNPSAPKSSLLSQVRPLNQTQLADRLGVVVSAITYWKLKPGFPEWSRSKDPEGVAWRYSGDSKRFSPEP
jgi:CheY-like chemotaxis protein